jgi:hypothetical protein
MGKDPGPEDPALVIPGGDLVYCNLNGSRSDGVLKELPDHLMEIIDKPSSRKPTAFYGFSNTPSLQYSRSILSGRAIYL